MAVTIDQVTAQKYSNRLLMLSQQKGSRLAQYVMSETFGNAEAAYFDQIGPDEDTAQKTARHSGTPVTEPQFARRKVIPVPWTNNKGLDKEDLDRMLTNPQSSVAMNQAYSLGRKKDDLIIAAATGTSYIGKSGGSTITLAAESIGLNSDGTVTTLGTAAAHAGTDTNITLQKMLAMMSIFNESEVDPDLPKYWVVAPKNIEFMLSLTQVGSYDYNTVKAIQAGKVDTFAGFKWMWSNRLNTVTSTSDFWQTFAFAGDGIGLGIIGEISTRIDERKDLDYMWQIFSKMDLGATRIEGAKVHECLALKTLVIA